MDDSLPDRTRRGFLATCGTALAAATAGCGASPFGGDDGNSGTGENVPPVSPRPGPEAGSDGQFDRFAQENQSSYASVYADVRDSVGQIQVYTSQGTAGGTGWVYRDEFVVTNQHVVENAEDIYVRFAEGGWVEAEVVGTDIYSDLAVMSVPEIPTASEGLPLRSSDPAVGTEVVAIGNPFGFSGSVSAGIVSGVNRAIEGPNNFSIPDAIQTDAAVNPGNSGGPLVSLAGNVAGVINSGGGDNVGFAISASLTRRVVPSLIRDGEYHHSYMGVGIRDVGPLLAEANDVERGSGVYVASVFDGGPADGVLRGTTGQTTVDGRSVDTGGDVVVRMEGTPVTTNNALATVLALETSPDDTVDVTVLRDGRERTVRLTLGAREDAT
mgnify:CR=1 FL=1